jgi:hypothetical protein
MNRFTPRPIDFTAEDIKSWLGIVGMLLRLAFAVTIEQKEYCSNGIHAACRSGTGQDGKT